MRELLLFELNKISKKMQKLHDADNITIMEAMCEIEDLQTKFDDVSLKYATLLRECRELTEKLVETGNQKLINPDWKDPNWQVGYITGVTETISTIEENINELH